MRQATGAVTNATLGQVCLLVTDGTHDTPKRVDAGYPLIKAKEIVGGQIDFESCDRISEEDHLKVISRSKPEAGDTLFAHIGASLGEAAYVGTSREFSIKNIALFKPNPAIVVPRYLYYLVVSPDFQALAKGSRTGSAQPFLSLGHLRSHPVRYHRDLMVQRRIASILSAYDDLIENNTRRIAILEQMARRIYEEWFVRFRFPGHDGVRMVESELGSVPEGWRLVTLGELVEFQKGKKPAAVFTEWAPGRAPALLIDTLRGGRVQFADAGRLVSVTRSDTIMVMDGSGSAQVFIGHEGVIGSTLGRYRVTKGAPVGAFWLYLLFLTRQLDIAGKNIGAAIPHANKDYIRSIPVPAPPAQVAARFEQVVEPMFDLIQNLKAKISTLRATRDLLLPKLISGELDVSAMPEPEGLAA